MTFKAGLAQRLIMHKGLHDCLVDGGLQLQATGRLQFLGMDGMERISHAAEHPTL